MTHGSLFSGIGGFDLAAEWMGWENKFHCEWDPFCQQVLTFYWPKAQTYADIKQSDFTFWNGNIDILTGGFPCQPYSAAGKRLGKEDDRHLWPEMLRAIREISPRWVVGENVRGLTNWNGGMVFDEVQADLEAIGYEVLPFLLPACAVNAPHRRDRIWFVAYAGHNAGQDEWLQSNGGKKHSVKTWPKGAVSDECGPTPDADIRSRPQHGLPTGWKMPENRINGNGNDSNTKLTRLEGCESDRQQPEHIQSERPCETRAAADAFSIGLRGQSNGAGKSGFLDETSAIPNWNNFPTQSPIRSRNDGISSELAGITVSKHRNESIKAYGNAVVPQVVYQIFKAIEIYE